MTAGLLGSIHTPAQGNTRPPGVTWCADNGCFGKGYPGDGAWWAWLEKHAHDASTCLFAVAPDVVGDAAATLERSAPWLPRIRALGYPAALVAQNGLEPADVPWEDIDVLFLGGSPECPPCGYIRPADERHRKEKQCPHCARPLAEWKLGDVARRLTADAKAHGKWVHMGRVNSKRRFRYARDIGCGSADGTYIAFGPDKNLAIALRWNAA